jgi:hypothetical protein
MRTSPTRPRGILVNRTLLALTLVATAAAPARAADPPAKPNVIFVLSDDIAQGDIGCYGQKLIRTPRLDAMQSNCTT